jgi:glycosyltransferase involved in cell wall biosynthesis
MHADVIPLMPTAGQVVSHVRTPRTVVSETPPDVSQMLPATPAGFRAISGVLAIAPRVSVVIPALNEAANLPHVFATLPPWIDEVVLVDGRSTDNTVAVARRLWPAVKIVTQAGRGKGDALLAGFAASTGDIIVTMDADGSTHGGEIVRYVAALVAGADFVKGSRFACGAGSTDITPIRRYGNRLLSGMVNVLFGTRYTDLCYGYNAIWASHLQALALDCDGFEVEAMLNLRAIAAGLRIHEVPSQELPRMYGASNLRVVTDGWRIMRLIIREWALSREARRSRMGIEPDYARHSDIHLVQPGAVAIAESLSQ